MLHPFEGAFLFFDTIIQYTHSHTQVYVHIYIYFYIYIDIYIIYIFIYIYLHIYIDTYLSIRVVLLMQKDATTFIQTPRAWEIHSSSKGCWRQSLGSRAWPRVPGNGWSQFHGFSSNVNGHELVSMVNLNITGHLPWLVDPPASFIANILYDVTGDFHIVCALVHALFRPQTKTHFEDTFLSGRVRERRREDTFRRHIKRRRISPRRRITPRRHISKTH